MEDRVAPHGGAWIEMGKDRALCAYGRSPLTEGRGLKSRNTLTS